jgi:hypothetical protein
MTETLGTDPADEGRRTYDPVVADLLLQVGAVAAEVRGLQLQLVALESGNREGRQELARHMAEEEHKIEALVQRLANLPSPKQWQALDALLVQREEEMLFWKDVRKSVIKRAIMSITGLVGAAVIYFIYSGHPPPPGG